MKSGLDVLLVYYCWKKCISLYHQARLVGEGELDRMQFSGESVPDCIIRIVIMRSSVLGRLRRPDVIDIFTCMCQLVMVGGRGGGCGLV